MFLMFYYAFSRSCSKMRETASQLCVLKDSLKFTTTHTNTKHSEAVGNTAKRKGIYAGSEKLSL